MDSFAEKNNFRQNRELSTYLYERPYNFLKEDTPAALAGVYHSEKFIAISILRFEREDFYRLHFLGSSYISRRGREEKTWRWRDKDKGGGGQILPILFFDLVSIFFYSRRGIKERRGRRNDRSFANFRFQFSEITIAKNDVTQLCIGSLHICNAFVSIVSHRSRFYKIYIFYRLMYKSDTLDGTIPRLTHYSVADNKWHVSERNGHYILLIGHYIGTLGFHECD